ncbi:MAG: hypothetical protein COA36_07440 [Desulfotalea sp.]|nr:MAG: hypothetical protein COA36_07440 [Desulfotalea sp.]
MSRLKTCIVLPSLSPYWHSRLKALVTHKTLDVSLCLDQALRDDHPEQQVQKIDGVKTYILQSTILKSTATSHDLNFIIQGRRSIPFRLFFVLWKIRPDIVVLCNATQILITLPLRLLLNFKIALIVEDTPHARRNSDGPVKHFKAWAYRQCDLFFPYSNDALAFLHNSGISDNIRRSSWSLDMETFRPLTMASPEQQKTKVIFVGRLISGKGIMLLLEAWQQLSAKTLLETELIIVGSGPLEEDINLFIQNNGLDGIMLKGQINYTQIVTELQNSDLFILPTLQDLFSLTVLEAMACGCPAITTNYNGARELITVDKTGWIVDPHNIKEMTQVLQYALSDKCDLKNMGQMARIRVEKMDNKIVMANFAKDLHYQTNNTELL